ncbi:hypothetical protein [Arthrobacter sp. EpRS71]|uniref:hypothetical protein n=1 Tax=Arthrobacter sp. EpRS71 TaxID=1743141 RepID=UPI000AB58282|nr:hypothetical protein [Arthrobacter sp. EpRS71]
MVIKSRAERLSDTFVKLTDTLVADYDVLDLLHTLVADAVELLDAAQAGLLLSDADGSLQLLASTSEQSWWNYCNSKQERARALSATAAEQSSL